MANRSVKKANAQRPSEGPTNEVGYGPGRRRQRRMNGTEQRMFKDKYVRLALLLCCIEWVILIRIHN